MKITDLLRTMFAAGIIAGLAVIGLAGCAPGQFAGAGSTGSLPRAEAGGTQTTVYAAATALTAADDAAIQCVTLPLCGPTHPAPLCSEAAISAQIKGFAQKAHDAVKAAETGGDSASLAAANAAISVLVGATPKS
jgi:hypothetical protein